MAAAGIEVRLLHSSVPSGPFLADLKAVPPRAFQMRRCPRVHLKAVIADGSAMYLGSANLTGAGMGAKSPRRRNFEAGVWTTDTAAIDRVADLLDAIWNGAACRNCGRRDHCPAPLETPWD
jgi:phosphatidylserine/phosphatidylglycerophosphate/cardiolipin synthase-like enzyme